MRGKDNRTIIGALVQFLDENGTEALQPIDDMAIVDDLVADIDRSPEFLDRALHDLDGPVDPGAEAARRGHAHRQRAKGGSGGGGLNVHALNLVASTPHRHRDEAGSGLRRLALAAIRREA